MILFIILGWVLLAIGILIAKNTNYDEGYSWSKCRPLHIRVWHLTLWFIVMSIPLVNLILALFIGTFYLIYDDLKFTGKTPSWFVKIINFLNKEV